MAHDRTLDWLNFFLADLRGGLGPYVSVFLLTVVHWTPGTIGAVLTVSGLVGITLQTPIGGLIDATRHKRGLLIAAVLILVGCAIAIVQKPTLPVVFAADTVMAILGAVFAPTVAAISLGLVGPLALARRLGRNAAFDRAGNLFIAGVAGFVGWWLSQAAVFYLVPLFGTLSIIAILAIPPAAIDHARARGLDTSQPATGQQAMGWRVLIERRPLVVLAIGLMLFHFANAPMLPLLGQKLALAHPGQETALVSACIVLAQCVMIPMALLVGRMANRVGRRPLLLIAFAALVMRGVLYTVSDNAAWLVGVQVLDGVAGGLLDTLVPLVLADIMTGTGRYNLARGWLGTVQGVGGSLSNVAAGVLVTQFGYDAAFLCLAGVAAVALGAMICVMPETKPKVRLNDEPASAKGVA